MNQQPTTPWWQSAIFYHIYPLGFCGALYRNDFTAAPVERIGKAAEWIPHLLDLGVNALYIGPLFESTYHGYDTANYSLVDRRLGTNAGLADLCRKLHESGIRVVFDAVFNHVGRDFYAFRDVQQNGQASPYCSWFANLRFEGRSPFGDPFTYEGWAGNYDLVKLNLANPDVRAHLFNAVRGWVDEFGIDGLRLDAADVLDAGFLRELRSFTSALKTDFWLMGEIVGGDYRRLANPDMLHSVTNYECYKGLYSSLAEKNYFEIAWSLNRQFGPDGLYRGLTLYNFADNHDVDRVVSSLGDPALLYPLYCLLFTMPGIPSIYYGSEWGVPGKRSAGDDSALRPALDLHDMLAHALQPNLPGVLHRLAEMRKKSVAFQGNGYAQLFVSHEQFAFLREHESERVVVALNASASPASIEITLPAPATSALDLLNPGVEFAVNGTRLALDAVPPRLARVLRLL
jgi:cyclomaltodextrinase / maltogenic alpha-amylase / neopullulanase